MLHILQSKMLHTPSGVLHIFLLCKNMLHFNWCAAVILRRFGFWLNTAMVGVPYTRYGVKFCVQYTERSVKVCKSLYTTQPPPKKHRTKKTGRMNRPVFYSADNLITSATCGSCSSTQQRAVHAWRREQGGGCIPQGLYSLLREQSCKRYPLYWR